MFLTLRNSTYKINRIDNNEPHVPANQLQQSDSFCSYCFVGICPSLSPTHPWGQVYVLWGEHSFAVSFWPMLRPPNAHLTIKQTFPFSQKASCVPCQEIPIPQWQPLFVLHLEIFLLVPNLHRSGIMQYVFFGVLLVSFSTTSLAAFIHVVPYIHNVSFLLLANIP